MLKNWLIVAFSCVVLPIAGQSSIWLHGQVVSSDDETVIPFAQVASYKQMQVFAADSVGEFTIIIDESDSIKVVALGFESQTFGFDSLSVEADKLYTFKLPKLSYQIQQVNINADKRYADYLAKMKAMRDKQREMDLMLPDDIRLGQKPVIPPDLQPVYASPPPVIAAFFQPLSFVHYYTSKSERQKVRHLRFLKEEEQRKLLTVDLITEVSGLEGDEIQMFVMYCNIHMQFNPNETPLSVKYKVIDLFNKFLLDEKFDRN